MKALPLVIKVMTLMTLPDEPLTAFRLACGASYATLRALYAREATVKSLAEELAISVQTIGSRLRALQEASLVRAAGTSERAIMYTLSDYGVEVLETVSGQAPQDRPQLAWLVTVAVDGAVPEEVKQALEEFGGETFTCAGDVDFISLFPEDGHDLALTLASRLRDRGARSARALVLPGELDVERFSEAGVTPR
jgi:DNA-binding transcriptional ArsR family regulator